MNILSIDYKKVKLHLPSSIKDLNMAEMYSCLKQVHNTSTEEGVNYLITLDHKAIKDNTESPWLGDIHHHITEWNRNEGRVVYLYTLFGILDMVEGPTLVSFPLRLYISNNIELVIHTHRVDTRDLYVNKVPALQFNHMMEVSEFQYELYRATLAGRMSVEDATKSFHTLQ